MAETDYPILVFPKPVRADRSRRHGGGGNLKRPDPTIQGERLSPIFERLQTILERRKLELQGSSVGITPEAVLVLETVGAIENFFKAIHKIEGLEWLGEQENQSMDPNFGFYDTTHPTKPLNGRIFLVMSDIRALNELRNLFKFWQEDPKSNFESGLAPLKKVFEHLYDIRPWSVQDRLENTGLIEDWKSREEFGQTIVFFEAELWFRNSSSRRQDSSTIITHLINELDGKIITECVIEEISYHSILGQIKIPFVRDIINHPEACDELELFRCQDIMYVRPVGQCTAPIDRSLDEDIPHEPTLPINRPEGSPVIALLDGLPLTKHQLLDHHLLIDDPDGFDDQYQAKQRCHGTAMASLICHGDLNSHRSQPLSKPIYVRPIMRPGRGLNDQEVIPDEILPVDLIHRAMVRIFVGEGGELPVAPEIRIVNLSIGDPTRQFVRELSGWARLIDWLSYNHTVLFVVMAGNRYHSLSLRIPADELRNLSKQELQKLVIASIIDDTRNRRLLSPAETINGLTVGALHKDESIAELENHYLDPLIPEIPSIITAHGPGYRRAIKPDILLPGGRVLLSIEENSHHHNMDVNLHFSRKSHGQCVATPGSLGRLDSTICTRGSSNSAALATREAFFLYELLENLRLQSDEEIPQEFDAVLLKTLLIHGAEWGSLYNEYKTILDPASENHISRDFVANFLGYGTPDFDRVASGSEQRVTVIGYGQLSDREACMFTVPMPTSLSGRTLKRRMTITLAWFSPINCQHKNYRVAHLWFSKPEKINLDRINGDYHAVQRGTVQHEIFEGSEAVAIQDGDEIVIKVNCREDAGSITQPIRFGMAMTLEVFDATLFPISIYQEVLTGIRTPVKA